MGPIKTFWGCLLAFACRLLLDPFQALVRNVALGDSSVERSAEMAASICSRFGDGCRDLQRLSTMAFSKHAERDFLRYTKQVSPFGM